MNGLSTAETLQKHAEKAHDAFVRWQQLTLTQLGYTANVISALSTAGLGFSLSLAVNQELSALSPRRCSFLAATLLFILSIAAGVCTSIARLYNFRHTFKTARGREMQARAAAGEKLSDSQHIKAKRRIHHRNIAHVLGCLTWKFLRTQVITFLCAVCLIAYALWPVYWR